MKKLSLENPESRQSENLTGIHTFVESVRFAAKHINIMDV